MPDIPQLVEDVVASPLGEVISSVGKAVAEAQQALDDAAVAKTLEIYGEEGAAGVEILRAIGYRPTFYALPETTGEVNVALSLAGTEQQGGGAVSRGPAPAGVAVNLSRQGLNIPSIKPKLYATPVNAGYANRYNYNASISAKLTFKIVPVPAPAGADEIRVVPDLSAKTAADAEDILAAVGLQLEIVDADGVVVTDPAADKTIASQEPAAQSYVQLGDVIRAQLG